MNDIVRQRLKSYRAKTAAAEKDALREIIQEITLLGLWRGKFFEHAAFYGGTALRILYGLDRFSEDLDFTLRTTSTKFNLTPYCRSVCEELAAYGFDAVVEPKMKATNSPIASAFIKANTLIHLIKIDSAFRAAKSENLTVKFEVDIDPAPGFTTEAKQFFWPIAFSVATCDLPSLFAGKLHALLCRERVRNIKGRDFYDFLWYIAREIKPNYHYLEAKLRQTNHWQAKDFTEAAFKDWAKKKLAHVDIQAAKRDIERFLPTPQVLDGWDNAVFLHAVDRL